MLLFYRFYRMIHRIKIYLFMKTSYSFMWSMTTKPFHQLLVAISPVVSSPHNQLLVAVLINLIWLIPLGHSFFAVHIWDKYFFPENKWYRFLVGIFDGFAKISFFPRMHNDIFLSSIFNKCTKNNYLWILNLKVSLIFT